MRKYCMCGQRYRSNLATVPHTIKSHTYSLRVFGDEGQIKGEHMLECAIQEKSRLKRKNKPAKKGRGGGCLRSQEASGVVFVCWRVSRIMAVSG